MKKTLIETLRLSMPLVILGLGAVGFSALASQREQPESKPVEESLPLVETVPVEVSTEGLEISVDGMVVPFREVNLSAEVAGRITRKFPECRAGRYVTAGTPLLEIDERTYQLTVKRLKEEVAQAENALQELDVEVRNYDELLKLLQEDVALKQRDLQRLTQLYQQNVINESELDTARASELTSRNALVSMQNQRRIAEASRDRLINSRDLAQTKLEEAELDLEKSKIIAPIDGVVVVESVEEGNYVPAGTSLVTIEDTSAAEVRTTLRMDEMNWIWQQGQSLGQTQSTPQLDYQLPQIPATITYELGGQEYQWEGQLWRYEGIGLNEKTRTVPVRILIPNPREVTSSGQIANPVLRGPKALVRGMFVKIKLHTTPNVQFLRIPERAVQPGNILWTVRDQTLRQVKLQNANYQNGGLIVAAGINGLEINDEVVITPLLMATDGMQVEVKPTLQADQNPPASESLKQ